MNQRAPTAIHRNAVIGLFATTLLLLLLFNVPWLPEPLLPHDLDSSWIMVLHHAFAHGLRWGHDIVWHYGPLGFLYGKFYYPQTYHWLIGGHVLLSLLFWLGTCSLWIKTRTNPMAPIAAAGLIILSDEVVFFAFSLLLILQYIWGNRQLRHPVFALLLFACAITGLIKFSYLLAALSAVIAIELHRLRERRMPGMVLLPFTALLAALWLMLGQRLGDVPAYLKGALELGYGFDAMATTYHPAFYVLLFIGLVVSWVFAATQTLWRAGRKPDAALFAGATLVQLFLVTKAQFLHDNDHHLIQALGWFFLMAVLTKDFFWPQRTRLATALIAFFAVTGFALVGVNYMQQGGKDIFRLLAAVWQQHATADVSPDSGIKPIVILPWTKYPQAMAQARADYPLAVGTGSVDIYNVYQATLLAHEGANYQPRPVFQSYHAYTPYLARLNRDYLRSPAAPQRIFFSLDNVLGRYPSIDDGLSWPELLARYDMTALTDGFIQLDKSVTPRNVTLTPYTDVTAHFNTPVPVPVSEGMVWAKVHIRPTWQGTLLRFFYKRVPVEMQFTLDSGYTRTDRMTPDTMGEGFLLSPLVDNTLQFAMLGMHAPERGLLMHRNRVAQIMFTYQSRFPHNLFKDAIDVQFYRLDIPAAPHVALPGWAAKKPYALLSSAMPAQITRDTSENRQIDIIQKKGQTLLSLYNSAAVALPLSPGQHQLRMSMGSFIATNHAKAPHGTIDITIEGHRTNGSNVPLWHETIPELGQQAASAPLNIDLAFAPGMYDAIIIRTHPQQENGDHWVYVNGVTLR